jgi:hypothetical protein
LLNKGKPMTNYEDLLLLFKSWNFDLSPKKISLMRLVGKWQNTLIMRWEKPFKLLSKMPSLYP